MMKYNPNRKLNRLQFGKLLGEAWGKSATVSNAVSGFRATGIWPYNPDKIPDHGFLTQPPNEDAIHPRDEFEEQNGLTEVSRETDLQENHSQPLPRERDSSQPGPSGMHLENVKEPTEQEVTPGKLLQDLSPVPHITPAMKKARVNLMGNLTSPSYMTHIRQKKQKQKQTSQPKPKGQKSEKPSKKESLKSTEKGLKRKRRHESTSSESDGDVILDDSYSGQETLDDLENQCVGCLEDYRLTKKKEDWLRCIMCSRWLHEGCTSYINTCQLCGAAPIMKKGKKKLN
ncbi:hypothetical protein QE152_g34119 [Popillia japonica]|uniref:Zinc finger PHD-type domain-containing protein n=1 Tax=Popillia japonica TaxID=7064 RepID=A0AAW1IUQ1_POPJA